MSMIFDLFKKLKLSNKKPSLTKTRSIPGLGEANYQLIFIDAPNATLVSQELLTNLERVTSVCEQNGYEFISYSKNFKHLFEDIDLNSLFYKYPFLRPYPISCEDQANEEEYRGALIEKFELQEKQLPAILFLGDGNEVVFELNDTTTFKNQFNKILDEVYSILHTRYSVVKDRVDPRGPTENTSEAEVDSGFVNDLSILTDKVYNEIDKLISSGNKKIIEEVYLFLVKRKYNTEIRTLSRIKIDSEFRIWLVDYGNIEIALTPLQKTVYLFFLSKPSGVYLHDLVDFKDELLACYKLIVKSTDEADLETRINDLVDVGSNSINEKCSRIKESFMKVISPDLAKHYYVSGGRGQRKGISLQQELILNQSPYQKL